MTLNDFANGCEPWLTFGRDVNTTQVKAWHGAGFIYTMDPVPDHFASLWQLTTVGRRECGLPVIDPTRWPYQCGKLDRQNGKQRNWHATNATNHAKSGLQPGSDSHTQWLAGWDSGK